RLKAVIHSEDASKSGAGYLEGRSKNSASSHTTSFINAPSSYPPPSTASFKGGIKWCIDKNTETFYGYSNTLEKEILMIGFILNVIISAIMLVVIFYGFKKLMR
ncbi:hypothetical protein, partial [Acidithiobacillus ferrivorans]